MKKLGVLLATMLVAILSISFSARADESGVFSSTELHMDENGVGSMQTWYYFNKDRYKFDDEFIKEVEEMYKKSGLDEYASMVIDTIEYDSHSAFIFSFDFNSIDEFNYKTNELRQCSLGSDIMSYSRIESADNGVNLYLDTGNLVGIEYAATWFLFDENPISIEGYFQKYNVSFNNNSFMYKEVKVDDVYNNEYLTFTIENENYATVKPADIVNENAKVKASATPNKTNAKQKDNTPKTGDTFNIVVYATLLMTSVAIMLTLIINKRNKNTNKYYSKQ